MVADADEPPPRVSVGDALPRFRAREMGVLIPGKSRSRAMLTTGTKKHVKFLRSDAEGPRALASEYLGARLLTLLGIDRPELCIVELPEGMRATESEFRAVTCSLGLGVEALSVIDLRGPLIAEFADTADDYEVLAQVAVIDLLGSLDHTGKNFLRVLGSRRLMAVDFAAAPRVEVWSCEPFRDAPLEIGGLGHRIERIGNDARTELVQGLSAIDDSLLERLMRPIPIEWLPENERASMRAKLISRLALIKQRYGPLR